MASIQIKHRLEILSGNKIAVPGCEPLSESSSPTLSQSLECNNVHVNLADAIAAIPTATIVSQINPTIRYFVLPDGPPSKYGCDDCTITDWYQILRNIGKPAEPEKIPDGCDSFPWLGCLFDQIFKG